jgi:hypothetical protein
MLALQTAGYAALQRRWAKIIALFCVQTNTVIARGDLAQWTLIERQRRL